MYKTFVTYMSSIYIYMYIFIYTRAAATSDNGMERLPLFTRQDHGVTIHLLTHYRPVETCVKLTGRLWLSQQVVKPNIGSAQMLKRTNMHEGSQIKSPVVGVNPANPASS